MQLANTSIPHGIAELLKRRASISSLARSRGFFRKTKSTALLLLKYTVKSNDLEKLLWKVRSAYRNFKVLRVQKWTRTSTRDSGIQLLTPCPLLKKCKISAPQKEALPKRILRSHRNIRHVLKFTAENFLREGITKDGFGQWTAILRGHDFKF